MKFREEPALESDHQPIPGVNRVCGAAEADFRARLTSGGNVVDVNRWAGSIPAANGITPRVRIGRSRWFNQFWLLPIGFVLLLAAVAVAKLPNGQLVLKTG
jgi:methionine sulfoxide reductase catalytic subunit